MIITPVKIVIALLVMVATIASIYQYLHHGEESTTAHNAFTYNASEQNAITLTNADCAGHCGQIATKVSVCVDTKNGNRVVDPSNCIAAGIPDPVNTPLVCPPCNWAKTYGPCSSGCGPGITNVTYTCTETNKALCGPTPAATQEACTDKTGCQKILGDETKWSVSSTGAVLVQPVYVPITPPLIPTPPVATTAVFQQGSCSINAIPTDKRNTIPGPTMNNSQIQSKAMLVSNGLDVNTKTCSDSCINMPQCKSTLAYDTNSGVRMCVLYSGPTEPVATPFPLTPETDMTKWNYVYSNKTNVCTFA